ncbi:acetylxylan esterase [Dyadobacter sp. LHD-138]|uniref:alpha/beta hydrolase n=1 Tax=Dyadobacter sp. LHD-138 TaxID=3071413 RepID=UPI0027E01976|nr:acetylxylan esterase [Dyadobacter sp. LHD-138]MDQ6479441.1 acetylxylan esterase [Dyadobacter sp. LHD-138]
MKYNALMLLTCCLLGLSNILFAQDELSVYNYWKFHQGTVSQTFYNELSHRAFEQLKKREVAIAKLKTKADWQKRQAEVRAKLTRAVGSFPEKTPLNPFVTGTLKKEDYTVEKLYYESRPGYHVTAALFIPEKRQEKAPAIIYCSGHSENGFRNEAYQHIILNYVKKGFIVLAFDPIGQGERIQYLPDELKKGAVPEHSYAGVQSFVSGLPPANYFIWDGIRTVDYLLTRKEVDPARIGIAGRSGGGTQSAYIAAMDDRILAAAPECYITTFDKLIRSNGPQDAEQNLMYGLESGIDMADFLEVRAPKPALIVSTTLDIFSIQGARDTYHESKRVYQAFGKAEQLQMTEDDAGHVSTLKNREASYAFFQKYLSNPGIPTDEKVEILTDKELHATPEGLVIPFLKGESMFSLNKKYALAIVEKRARDRKATPDYQKSLRGKMIGISGYVKPTGKKDVVFSGRIQKPYYAIEKYLVKGNGDYYIPVLWLKPKTSSGKTILFLNEGGKSMAAQKGQIAERLVGQGFEVVLPDVSGTGELASGFMKSGDSVIDDIPLNLWFTGILTHKNLVAVRAEEISILADFVKSAGAAKTLSAVASGTLTSDLLHAAAIENPFHKLVLINPLISYQSITEEKLYKTKFALSAVAGAMPVYDLPDLVDMLSSQGLLLINPITATEKEIDQNRANSIYAQALKQTDASNFEIRRDLKSDAWAPSIISWIK